MSMAELPTITDWGSFGWVEEPEKPKVRGIRVPAAEFQRVMFGDLGRVNTSCRPLSSWTRSKAGNREWAGWGTTELKDYPNRNSFTAPAIFKGEVEGKDFKTGEKIMKKRRRYALMHRMTCVPADDVQIPGATYVVQTSPKSYQSWFKLGDPIMDEGVARRLSKEMQRRGHEAEDPNDPSGNNGVRWARMPAGVNTKAKYGRPFRHVVQEWNPEQAIHAARAGGAAGPGPGVHSPRR